MVQENAESWCRRDIRQLINCGYFPGFLIIVVVIKIDAHRRPSLLDV